jgi:hypothetical protein
VPAVARCDPDRSRFTSRDAAEPGKAGSDAGGPTRVHEVGKTTSSEKNNSFLAEMLSKLRFSVLHSPSTPSTPKNIRRVGPA